MFRILLKNLNNFFKKRNTRTNYLIQSSEDTNWYYALYFNRNHNEVTFHGKNIQRWKCGLQETRCEYDYLQIKQHV